MLFHAPTFSPSFPHPLLTNFLPPTHKSVLTHLSLPLIPFLYLMLIWSLMVIAELATSDAVAPLATGTLQHHRELLTSWYFHMHIAQGSRRGWVFECKLGDRPILFTALLTKVSVGTQCTPHSQGAHLKSLHIHIVLAACFVTDKGKETRFWLVPCLLLHWAVGILWIKLVENQNFLWENLRFWNLVSSRTRRKSWSLKVFRKIVQEAD